MKKIILSVVLALSLILTVPVFAEVGNIVEVAVDAPQFSILVEAVTEAGLVDALSGPGPFTVFAPTDDAFADLLTDLGVTKEELLDHPDLADVLLFHVVSGQVMSTDLTDGMTAPTLEGEELTFSVGEGGVFVNDSEVTAADIPASNGVIHQIDKVLVPESFGQPKDSIVDIAVADDNFSILVEALIAADLVETLEGEGPFTVFAPDNAAFEDLLSDLGITADDLLAHPDLSKVLLYHVLSGKIMSTDLSDGLTAETLQGENLVFTLSDEGAFVNESEITAADIEATNGVIHVIGAVLVPDEFVLETDYETQPGDSFPFIWVAGAALALASIAYVSGKKKLMKNENK